MSAPKMVPLRGGPADGKRAEPVGPTTRYIAVPVQVGGGFGEALYLVERVNGKPVYAQYVPSR